ncbi:MAG: class I SAM-dependent methyltransferase [Gammaproteobacteria bacterium]|nr:class I SAM-dependent methyltransferase [Gammaproteobacteria bacterium]
MSKPKPFSQACDNNREPILGVIRPLLADCRAVLEIGSGTGQHAAYFATELPHLQWLTSDLPEHHAGIRMWTEDADLPNLHAPLTLDVLQYPWPDVDVDAVFSANTAHIMSWQMVEALFGGVVKLLPAGGQFLLYGPFNYAGNYTSDSNAIFDGWLKARDPESGIRNFEQLQALAEAGSMSFVHDYEMPANNRILHWRKDD